MGPAAVRQKMTDIPSGMLVANRDELVDVLAAAFELAVHTTERSTR